MKFEKATSLNMPDAEEKVIAALQTKGFGVLTRIDVRKKLKEKLSVNSDPYVILGACNPELAHKILKENSDVGYLLPCNVLVYEKEGKVRVGTVLPTVLLSAAGDEVRDVACEAEKLLKEVINMVGE
jgi:uncharacterized protein (DUF302 family)